MRLFRKWTAVLIEMAVGGGSSEGPVATVDLNAIGDVQQLETYVGKRVMLIGRAGLGPNSRLATLEGRAGGGVVVLTDVEKTWPETVAPRVVEVIGELGIEKIETDKVASQELDQPTNPRGFSLRRSQVVRWVEEEQVAGR